MKTLKVKSILLNIGLGFMMQASHVQAAYITPPPMVRPQPVDAKTIVVMPDPANVDFGENGNVAHVNELFTRSGSKTKPFYEPLGVHVVNAGKANNSQVMGTASGVTPVLYAI